ncbi:Protein Iojap-related like [Actinidia chinensis var. chinensis]|uniref:Protein Iojap-related like n=1 Tax=Actinidia chinensis var. chinensis TaxID=1590841 RepID=A0A2R6P3C2_ACTCC|nr:Protein Iojap-related like [Actinidia chinensis var. chinensis]
MWPSLRSPALFLLSSSCSSLPTLTQQWKLGFSGSNRSLFSSLADSDLNKGLLNLEEVQKILTDVKADDVKVVPVRGLCDWTNFMVFVTGRSTWHVRNIAQALIYKINRLSKSKEGLRGSYSPVWREKGKGSELSSTLVQL